MTLKTNGSEISTAATGAGELSESALAVQEFASLIAKERHRIESSNRGTSYEVHPCKRVRGYMLRLPVIGWTLWYPTAHAAMTFAGQLSEIHAAECCVYDAEGSRHLS
jgi:hypothetical protein